MSADACSFSGADVFGVVFGRVAFAVGVAGDGVQVPGVGDCVVDVPDLLLHVLPHPHHRRARVPASLGRLVGPDVDHHHPGHHGYRGPFPLAMVRSERGDLTAEGWGAGGFDCEAMEMEREGVCGGDWREADVDGEGQRKGDAGAGGRYEDEGAMGERGGTGKLWMLGEEGRRQGQRG
eukprot:325760-Rhodomonas_salina.1